jgi:NHLM bacteriocin system ABC transporter peptidase/ATP-binding protein
VRTPTVLQMEAVECGAAALGIILGYHGRHVALEKLRAECGVSRDGSKASNLVKVARGYGLEARVFRMELAGIQATPPPLVVFWDFRHFLVVEGFGRDCAYVNDPATGPRRVSLEEFDRAFTGLALAFTPGPEFRRGGERPSVPRALARRLSGTRTAFVFVLLAGLGLIGPGLLVPTLGRVFVDEVLVGGAVLWGPAILLSLALTAVLRGVLTALQKRYLGRLETRLALTSASAFLGHVLRLPMEFFTQRYAGDVSRRVMLNDVVARLLAGQLATNLLGLVALTFYAALMIAYDALLGLLCVAVATLNLLLLYRVTRLRADQSLALQSDLGRLHATAIGGLQTIETLKATGGEAEFFERFAGVQARVMNGQQRLGTTGVLLGAVPPLLSALSAITVLGVGALRVLDGHLSLGLLVAFQSLMASFFQPVNELVRLAGSMQEAHGHLSRLEDVLRYDADASLARTGMIAEGTPAPVTATSASAASSRAAGPAMPARRLQGAVELRGVTFGYSRLEPPLIVDFELVLQPGSRVALVGGSGSGKSTLARLVTGLYSPWAGEVLFDGRPRHAWPREWLVQSLAAVDQDIFLFHGSVRENLTLWDASVPEALLIEAARDACIHDEITARPGAYESLVEEGGLNFSGGQRQRLELARALVGRPSVLVLDEATSALDARTEARLDRALRRRGCTCLIVAHRLSTIRDCDEIVVLDRGRVAERGVHAQLLAADGLYASLVRLQ